MMEEDHKNQIETPTPPQRLYPLEGPEDMERNSGIIKAMIFDLDGTVVNSIESDYEAWKKTFEAYDVEFPYQAYVELSGATSTEIVDHFLDLSRKDTEDFVEKKSNHFINFSKEKGLEAMPYIEGLLKQVKEMSFKTALATSGRRSKVDFMMEKIKLGQYFDELVTADDLHRGKPDPEIFLKAAEKLRVKPEEALVWEDATLGVEAAKNGNFKCIAITTTQKGERKGLEKADKIIDSYEGITIRNLLNELFTKG